MMKAKNLIIIFCSLLFVSGTVLAKRTSPPELKAIVVGQTSIAAEYTITPQLFQAYLKATHQETQSVKLLWKSKIYEIQMNPELEQDVQHVYLKSLVLEDGVIVATDERGNVFRVDPSHGTLER